MFYAANWTSNLASCNVFHVLSICNRSFLNMFYDAVLTHAITTV